MPDIEVKDRSNKTKGTVNLPDQLFGRERRTDIVHASVVNFLANQRQGTHATKSKGLISGGGKKPWKQKHTGRARSGSNRSPIWRGGGTVFGPQPRDYSYSLPKSMKRRALAEALSAKLSDGEMIVMENLVLEKPKTKAIVEVIKNLGLDGKSVLLILPAKDENILRSARNIPAVSVASVSDLNPYQIVAHDRMVMTEDAVNAITAEVTEQ